MLLKNMKKFLQEVEMVHKITDIHSIALQVVVLRAPKGTQFIPQKHHRMKDLSKVKKWQNKN